jgi:glucoamylase
LAAATTLALASAAITISPAAAGNSGSATGVSSYFGMGRKDCVGTAQNTTSKIWYTVANGVLSDVYGATVDITNLQSLQYIVTDGSSWTDLQASDMTYTAAVDSTGMSCTITSTPTDSSHDNADDHVHHSTASNTVLIKTTMTGASGTQYYVAQTRPSMATAVAVCVKRRQHGQ